MAQHDGVIDNGTGNAVRTDINNALAAINSNNSGASDPSTTYAYQFYADTGDNTLKIRNAANDGFVNVSITGGIGTENFGLAPLSGGTFTGNVSFPDDVGLRFGGSNDGIIQYYNSSDSFRMTTADGADIKIDSDDDLTIECDDDMVLISGNGFALKHGDLSSNENMIVCNADAAVELYHDNTKTFETTASGFSAIGGTFTGDVILDNQSDLRFEEATANGSNFIALQAPAAITSDVTLTLPAVAPTAGQVLQADSSTPTTLTWGSASGVGGATGVDFNDDVAIRFGDSNDGVIQYVSSTDAFTISTADGADIKLDSDDDLTIECDDDMNLISGDGIALKHGTSSSSENMIVCNDDSSVALYHNGNLRLQTINAGIEIFGSIENIGVGTAVAVLREVQPHATDAGTFSNGADRVRVLNTEQHDGEAFCTLDTSTGEFTLPAGTYLMYFQAVAFDVGNHRTKIVTDGGTDKLFGENCISNTAYPNQYASSGFGVVTNASSEGYFLKHRCTTSRSTNGFGKDMDFASEEEFYSQVIIWRMD